MPIPAESFAAIYRYDAETEERALSPEAQLRFHQEHSGPVIEKLHAWLRSNSLERKVETDGSGRSDSLPSSEHWTRLTLFLQQAGAPLDSNVVERALKKAILHRKNSLFYRTEKGAEVGELFMSLILTCGFRHQPLHGAGYTVPASNQGRAA